ncbi:MAG: hypothetical protein LN588_01260 [Rickettsia endosymbiont of Bryobia graminum]|nr:hypothetical protein [Rickettsia endosymbiont of Bryobia graminum]
MYQNNAAEEELIGLMQQHGIDMDEVDPDIFSTLAGSRFVPLIRDNSVDINDLLNLDLESLQYICNNDSIVQELQNKKIDFVEFQELLENNFADFVEVHRYNNSVAHILTLYRENPLHLRFLNADNSPEDIVRENADDAEIVRFAIRHGYVDDEDIASIQHSLMGDDDNIPAAYMEFQAHLIGMESDSN